MRCLARGILGSAMRQQIVTRPAFSAYDKAAIMFRGWDAETNAPTEV